MTIPTIYPRRYNIPSRIDTEFNGERVVGMIPRVMKDNGDYIVAEDALVAFDALADLATNGLFEWSPHDTAYTTLIKRAALHIVECYKTGRPLDQASPGDVSGGAAGPPLGGL